MDNTDIDNYFDFNDILNDFEDSEDSVHKKAEENITSTLLNDAIQYINNENNPLNYYKLNVNQYRKYTRNKSYEKEYKKEIKSLNSDIELYKKINNDLRNKLNEKESINLLLIDYIKNLIKIIEKKNC